METLGIQISGYGQIETLRCQDPNMSGSGQLRQVLAYLNSLRLTTQVAWPPVGLNARGYVCVCCIGESNEEEGHRMYHIQSYRDEVSGI